MAGTAGRGAALILVFASGFAALVYQVLWMRQLGLLFGNTSHAAAVTLAAFFGGLAVGGWFWGRRSAAMRRPLRAYGWLELCIAVSAGLYFVILRLYHAIYPALYAQVGSAALLLAAKFALALLLVFPPAVFMGGTIPVMGQHLVAVGSRSRAFGTTAALLYAVNTIGAAGGALLAGFYLPMWLGFGTTAAAAIALTTATAVAALLLGRGESETAPPPQAAAAGPVAAPLRERLPLSAICFLSGFGFLALEVVWTRMFMQVLENSVYTFAAILVVVLVCLAVGAVISAGLARLNLSPVHVLAALVLLGGVAVVATPRLFMATTHGMEIIATRGSWASYVLLIFYKVTLTIGPAALTLGTVFPYLMKTEERYVRTAGRSLGRLAAINTAGAIVGALLCGFVLLGTLGMWGTTLALGAAYLVACAALPLGGGQTGVAIRGGGAIALLLALTWLNPIGLPLVSTDPGIPYKDTTLKVWEASDNTVAVTRGRYGMMIKVNSHYGLGTTGSAAQERMQNDLPLKVFPDTSNIFFLGMGTGITAGAALDEQFPRVNRVVVCELSAQVIEAAREYITDVDGVDFTGGLFDDPRAEVLAEDGRHYLMATRERFDMVNGDLFVPFRAGVGSLYTREHFQNVKDRLSPGGVFVQWLPLYQVTEQEFSVIARTMLEVFDQVTLWRSSFQPPDDTVALVGHMSKDPLPAIDTDSRDAMRAAVAGRGIYDLMDLYLPFNEQTALLFYCGNLTEAAELFADYPVNTDDKPVIEYLAPRTFRANAEDANPWFVGPRLAQLVEKLHAVCPPATDPMLANRSAADRQLPLAGRHFYGARLWLMIGDPQRTGIAWRQFLQAWSGEAPAAEAPGGD